MAAIPEDLTTFLAEKRDSREYRRGLAVKFALQGYLYEEICKMLDVTPGYISQAKKSYETTGTAGLLLKHQGSQPYLSPDEREAVISWIKVQKHWSVEALHEYIETTYDVVFQSRQSYYQLLEDAGMSYKQSERTHPKHNPEQVAAKKKRSSQNEKHEQRKYRMVQLWYCMLMNVIYNGMMCKDGYGHRKERVFRFQLLIIERGRRIMVQLMQ
jgi:putative transposase